MYCMYAHASIRAPERSNFFVDCSRRACRNYPLRVRRTWSTFAGRAVRSAQGHRDAVSRVLSGERCSPSQIQVRQGRVRTAPVCCAGRWTCTLYFDVSSAASSHLAFTYQRILLSPSCSIAQTRWKWARELYRSSSVAKSAIILDSLRGRRSPSVHFHHSENRTSR